MKKENIDDETKENILNHMQRNWENAEWRLPQVVDYVYNASIEIGKAQQKKEFIEILEKWIDEHYIYFMSANILSEKYIRLRFEELKKQLEETK